AYRLRQRRDRHRDGLLDRAAGLRDLAGAGMRQGDQNDNDQTSQLEPYFDWALDEQCNQYAECDTENVFVQANKAVFNAEYQGGTGFCSSDEAAHINGALFDLNLDGSTYQPCTGGW
ncbi:MAG: endo alpha-1,4 polygalactosaminidase, partial [Acidimicrobiia bacterium]